MAAKCTVTVCESCGLVDDHETRQCPRLQRCSNCGQIGHLWAACTSEHQAIKCSQCGARTHRDENCLLIWREYKYDMDSKPEYPPNVSCYNCASTSHYGDECNKPRPVELRYREGSAFSGYNMSKHFLERYRRYMDEGIENEKRESNRPHSRSHNGSKSRKESNGPGSNGSKGSKKSKKKDGARKDDYKAQMKHSEHKHREKMQGSGNPLRKRINNMKKRR